MKFDTAITMSRFVFPATLTPDKQDGGFIVTFRDLPEAITQGDSIEQSLFEAADCLEEAIAARIDDKLDIPEPSSVCTREIHRIREEHAKSFNYDLNAMFADWQKKQAASGREIVSLSPQECSNNALDCVKTESKTELNS
jgi:predicted RNase H-like HicB family nuclease